MIVQSDGATIEQINDELIIRRWSSTSSICSRAERDWPRARGPTIETFCVDRQNGGEFIHAGHNSRRTVSPLV